MLGNPGVWQPLSADVEDKRFSFRLFWHHHIFFVVGPNLISTFSICYLILLQAALLTEALLFFSFGEAIIKLLFSPGKSWNTEFIHRGDEHAVHLGFRWIIHVTQAAACLWRASRGAWHPLSAVWMCYGKQIPSKSKSPVRLCLLSTTACTVTRLYYNLTHLVYYKSR